MYKIKIFESKFVRIGVKYENIKKLKILGVILKIMFDHLSFHKIFKESYKKSS